MVKIIENKIQLYYCPMCKKAVPIKTVQMAAGQPNKYICKNCGCETSKI